jgi:hypothetical protein
MVSAGCEKTRFGGRREFQLPQKAGRIGGAFSPGRALSGDSTRNLEFFHSLHSPRIGLKWDATPPPYL